MKTLISNRNHSQQRKLVQSFESKLCKYMLIFFFTLICHFSHGQNGQELDSLYIYNDLGERLVLDDVIIPQNSGGCNAGFFNLIFTDPGVTGFNDPTNVAIRNTVCQVFSDLSVLINPADNPYTGASNVNNPYVNIRVRTVGMANFLPARGYSNYLIFPGNFYSGVLDGEVWRTINGGVDSYLAYITFASTAVGGANGIPPQLFHGNLDFDFTTYGTYNSNITVACALNEIDVYSLVLQEAFHMLGLNTLLRANGTSAFNPEVFYSRFDSQLRENNVPIINNWFPCDQISYSGQPLNNGCASTIFSGNQAMNVPVFSPSIVAIEEFTPKV